MLSLLGIENNSSGKNRSLLLMIGILLFIAYGIDRVEHKFFTPVPFSVFIGLISLSFGLLFWQYQSRKITWSLKEIFRIGVLLRVLVFFMFPNLSDDFHRFIWDGILVLNGENPYLYLPADLYQTELGNRIGLSQKLYEGFNSHYYYSVYPPVNQSIFALSVWIGGDSIYQTILSLRFFILLAEIGSLFFLAKLIERFKLPSKNLLLYAFNPLVILELIGNLHFEAIMIFFLIGALYFLSKKQSILSGLFWGLAIGTKLIPILFLPFLLRRVSFKKTVLISVISILTFALILLPFWAEQLPLNVKDSLDKYFGYFEFNAGIPYFIRWIGFHYVDFSILPEVMPHMSKVIVAFVLIYSILPVRSPSVQTIVIPILWTGVLYFLLAGILHPWYITYLVAVSVLTNSKFAIFWSFLIFFSYSAYQTVIYAENYYLVALEFLLLGVYLILSKTGFLDRLINKIRSFI